MNDFMNMYAGARLVGTPDQFHSRKYAEDELAITGWASPAQLRYLRLPVFAFLLRPLTALSYTAAYHVWQVLMLAAFLGFWWLWPEPRKQPLVVAACWSVPLVAAIANGQDIAFLMLFLAALWRYHDSRPWLAGLCLALCALKFHLFLLMPVMLIAQRKWRVAAWASGGVLALLVASTLVSTERWVPQFIDFVLSDKAAMYVYAMPNLAGFFTGLEHAAVFEIVAGLLVAAVVAWFSAHSDFVPALGAALIGGLLTSHHAYFSDTLLLLPVLALIASGNGPRANRIFALLLLSPLPFLVYPQVPFVAPLPWLLILLLAGLVWTKREEIRSVA
jgi:hypothetical protein